MLRKGSAHKLGTVKQVEVIPMNMCFHGIPLHYVRKQFPLEWDGPGVSCVTLSDWPYFSEPPLPHL